MKEIMALQERIEQGHAAILRARGEGKDVTEWVQHMGELEDQLLGLLDAIPVIKLSEFEKQDYSIEIYSTVLNQAVWFCPDKEAAAQIKRDDPEAVTYTPDELRHLITLNPVPESFKRIHTAKEVLSGSLINQKVRPCI